MPGVGWGVAAAAASGVASYAPNWVYVTYTQYKSKQTYTSSYDGIKYNKCINQKIRIYKNSVSSKNLVYGPFNGSWFNPVRP